MVELMQQYRDTMAAFNGESDALFQEYADRGYDITNISRQSRQLRLDIMRDTGMLRGLKSVRRPNASQLKDIDDLEDKIEVDNQKLDNLNNVLTAFDAQNAQIVQDMNAYVADTSRYLDQLNAHSEITVQTSADTKTNAKFGQVNVFYNFTPALLFADDDSILQIHSLEVLDNDSGEVFVKAYLTDDFPVREMEMLNLVRSVAQGKLGLPADNLDTTESGTAEIRGGFHTILYIDGTW